MYHRDADKFVKQAQLGDTDMLYLFRTELQRLQQQAFVSNLFKDVRGFRLSVKPFETDVGFDVKCPFTAVVLIPNLQSKLLSYSSS